ncbi:MAG TPA: hypothetical protein VMH39_17210 [Gemmatimonadaceae bacterium]|nr:hypothetical protein [Gemmatimonadaceae bacterium]
MKLHETFAVLRPDLSVGTIAVTPTIYEELDAAFNQFRSHVLIASFEFERDWETWERHPAGDEIVILVSGAATLKLRKPSGDEAVELREPGAFIIIPRNTWHTAEIGQKTRMIFVTPGEATENRADI